jgi:hypothetical protein
VLSQFIHALNMRMYHVGDGTVMTKPWECNDGLGQTAFFVSVKILQETKSTWMHSNSQGRLQRQGYCWLVCVNQMMDVLCCAEDGAFS